MGPVICDTGPINYFVLIERIDILPALFEKIVMPFVVLEELMDANTPPAVRKWIARPPTWLEVLDPLADVFDDDFLGMLGRGERDAIRGAVAFQADLLFMDDRAGVKAAIRKGLDTTGTIGVLNRAAKQGLLDSPKPSRVCG